MVYTWKASKWVDISMMWTADKLVALSAQTQCTCISKLSSISPWWKIHCSKKPCRQGHFTPCLDLSCECIVCAWNRKLLQFVKLWDLPQRSQGLACHQTLLRFFLFHGLMDNSMSHHRLYCARKPASIHVPCLFAIGIPNNNEHGIWSGSILLGENPSMPWAIERSTCRRRSSGVA